MTPGIALFAVALLAQQGSLNIGIGSPPKKDSVQTAADRVRADSVRRARAARRVIEDSLSDARRRARAIPVTPELLASAFKDAAARTLLLRGRAARVQDDSALTSYDAKASERMSVRLALTRFAPERLLARYERAARVQWLRGSGARVEILGERLTVPITSRARSGGLAVDMDLGGATTPPIPYFPGREPLWGAALAKMNATDRDMVNPVAAGAEAYYTYESGDSATFQLPGRAPIRIRELLVRPRKSDWRLSVGSLWFDESSGRLVRGVYRMSEALDLWRQVEEEEDQPCGDTPRLVCSMLDPAQMTVSVVAVEYGLHEGRFWLPRLQTLEGNARVAFIRAPFKLEQSFTYSEVNGRTMFAPVLVAVADTSADSTAARHDETIPCGADGTRERIVSRFENTLPIAVRVPCDSIALARSPELPASPYDPAEELFGSSEMDELTERALGMAAQAGFIRRPPQIRYGLGMTRYNRVEGLSTGIGIRQSLGAGYRTEGSLRFGLADLEPNAELALYRTNGRSEIGIGAFRRLAAANDWGEPLGFGSSISSLVFGRDEGFYYRSVGLEISSAPLEGRSGWITRLFGEHHSDAIVETSFSVANAISDKEFRDNIDADNGTVGGISLRRLGTRGIDPLGLRLFSDLRLEAAVGTFDYSRAALDLTAAHPIAGALDAALTVAAGASGGALPVQRWWFLGGAHTVRGQSAGTLTGNSFWLGRLELGTSRVVMKPVLFADFGWAGDRSSFGFKGQHIAGAGAGMAFLDGLVRIDLAKGIRPERGFRGYFYLNTRF